MSSTIASMRVLKFGGAAFKTPADFAAIAELIEGPAVVVVSAMHQSTDQLINLARQVHLDPPKRELDMLVSTGERVSMALLAMALSMQGKEAISLTGSQSGIITSSIHSEAKIITVRPYRILEALQKNKVVIVAGFQGVSEQREITTLGRGGSDTTAVALGLAISADEVVFYKDVPGFFTSDPKLEDTAQHLPHLNYQKALEIVERGGRILHSRAIKLAEKNGLPLHIQSFKRDLLGSSLISDSLIVRLSPPLFEDDAAYIKSG